MNNLDEIFQYLEKATRYDHYICALCPFHDDTRPSFFVYEDSYKCFSCDAKGKTSDLLDKLSLISGNVVPTKKYYFTNPWTIWMRSHSLIRITEQAHLQCIENNKTIYMKERGINLQTIKDLRLGYRDNWIVFPIFDQHNHVIGGTARAGKDKVTESKYINPKGQDPDMLFVPSWQRVIDKQTVFLTFGIIDAISIYQLGYASMSTTTGKRLNPDALSGIRKKIVIIPDDGEVVEAVWLSANLGWRGKVMKIEWADGMKDVNDLFIRHRPHLEELLQMELGVN